MNLVLFQLLFQQLFPVQLGVQAVTLNQLVVRATLGDASLIEHEDLVCPQVGTSVRCAVTRGRDLAAR